MSVGTGGGYALQGVTGATYNPLTGTLVPPLGHFGDFQSFIRYLNSIETYGIIDEGLPNNEWESSRALFFGWLWGGGYPLKPQENFRGGDKFTAILASDATFAKWRSILVGQAVKDGMGAPNAKKDAKFSYQDKGPEPGSPWWRVNSLRGAALDLSGTLSNGAVGMRNSADAFLGTYSATGRIVSVDRDKGTVQLQFTATNTSDWRSATHLVPKSWNPLFEKTFGAATTQNFSWRENLPLNSCMCVMK
ncbi:hypothetical protein ACI2LJ_09880 [Streptomyces sp. NPDC088090]|uniref:hypothetical protein n=1 Tax=Streptomyces sp. NPDC088090 TaxID=3365822 RepID=UPI00384DCED7